jgi:hypothetical protein
MCMKTLRFIKILLIVSFLVSCMAKMENEDVIDSVEITSHEIERNGQNAKIILHGTCPKYTSALKVNASTLSFDVVPSSMTNPSAWVEGSGVPIGECNNGVLRVEYPVPNPTQSRVINFKVKAKMPDGKISLYAAIRDVDYSIPSQGIPGFAVTSGGDFKATDGITIHASVGIAHGNVGGLIYGSANASLRSGLQGILYDDTIQ